MRHLARPQNWRVRHKLTAVVLIPGLLAGFLTTVGLSRTIGDADDYGRFAALARLQRPALGLVHALQDERDATAAFVAERREGPHGGLGGPRAAADTAAVAYRRAAGALDTSGDPHLRAALRRVAEELRTLGGLRAAVDEAALTQGAIVTGYTVMLGRLLDLGPVIAEHNGGGASAQRVRALNALSVAVENTSRVRAELNAVLTTGTFLVGQFPDFAGAVARQQESVDDFLATTSRPQRTLYADAVKGTAVSATQAIQERAAEQAQAGRISIEPARWNKVSSRKIALMRTVESRILDELITVSEASHASRRWAAWWGAAGMLAMLLATGWVVSAAVRSMTRPLKTLRASALDVAHHRLPEALARLRQADADDLGDFRATPTGVVSGDEIGEVARAFDAVQNAAVRLATDQAALRAHINGMFVHLSRRNQRLVGKLLGEIGDLEQDEGDPERLGRLFRLDHLATQMLRTDESLLVLAGSDTGRGWDRPMPLSEVLLAASAEVEQYARIVCRPAVEADIAGDAVTDLVHLLAELMENATHFSGLHSAVTVTCGVTGDRTADPVISIVDEGVGMTPEEMAVTNHRLASVSVFDPEAGQSMGLFVVSRLASRHGISVTLAPSPGHGTTALVRLPRHLLARLEHPAADGPEYPGAQHPGQVLPPQTSAAEPAFGSAQDWLVHRRFSDGLHAAADHQPPAVPFTAEGKHQ
ncbi:sensor histidine kinase [Streptomyces africanus]|uniref:sensor histidine kinase n=1 Tax=Streptomyces africanus TaxID=231024 RepID=UPI001302E14B|nr:sensor histidine kinase [Streptomyces africanus]